MKSVDELIEEINKLTQEELARLIRFAPVGHEYFTNAVVYRHFSKRFAELGGMTPEISKRIGWNR